MGCCGEDIPTFDKDPNAVLDYSVDWFKWLGTDTISVSTWVRTGPDSVLTIDFDTEDATTSTVMLSSGTLSKVYTLVNHITTVGGRQNDQTIKIIIKNQ